MTGFPSESEMCMSHNQDNTLQPHPKWFINLSCKLHNIFELWTGAWTWKIHDQMRTPKASWTMTIRPHQCPNLVSGKKSDQSCHQSITAVQQPRQRWFPLLKSCVEHRWQQRHFVCGHLRSNLRWTYVFYSFFQSRSVMLYWHYFVFHSTILVSNDGSVQDYRSYKQGNCYPGI